MLYVMFFSFFYFVIACFGFALFIVLMVTLSLVQRYEHALASRCALKVLYLFILLAVCSCMHLCIRLINLFILCLLCVLLQQLKPCPTAQPRLEHDPGWSGEHGEYDQRGARPREHDPGSTTQGARPTMEHDPGSTNHDGARPRKHVPGSTTQGA